MSEFEEKPLSFGVVKKKFPEAKEVHGRSGLQYNVHCRQYHKKGGMFKMYISASNGAFYCNDCGFAGNAHTEFFSTFDRLFGSLKDTSPIISAHAEHEEIKAKTADAIMLPYDCVPLSILPIDHVACQYIHSRGFDLQEVVHMASPYYCITQSHEFKMCRGRIIFPVTLNGKLVGWQARKIEAGDLQWNGDEWVSKTKSPKYFTCPGMKTSDVLYNFDIASTYKWGVITEGVFDVLAVGRNCVAMFGKNLSLNQAKAVQAAWTDVVFVRDPEIKRTDGSFQKNVRLLEGIRVFDLALSNGRDAGSTPRPEIWADIQKAIDQPETASQITQLN